MARVKNTHCVSEKRQDETNLSPAVFPRKRLELKTKLKKCPTCGKVVRASNLARHLKAKHFSGVRPVTPGSPTPSITVETSPQDRVKFHVRLPAVTRTIQERVAAREVREETYEHLPRTPEDEEDLNRQLAKLYSARAAAAEKRKGLSYYQTRALVAVAVDEDIRDEVKEVLRSGGLLLHTQAEWDIAIQEAEERGRIQATASPVLGSLPSPRLAVEAEGPTGPAGTPRSTARLPTPEPGTSLGPVTSPAEKTFSSAPPLVVSSVFKEGEPQVVTVHSGGVWGLRIQPYQFT